MSKNHQLTIQTDDLQLKQALSSIAEFRASNPPTHGGGSQQIAFGARVNFGPFGAEFTINELLDFLKHAPEAVVEGVLSAIKKAIQGAREVRLLVDNKEITVEQLEDARRRARLFKDFDMDPFQFGLGPS